MNITAWFFSTAFLIKPLSRDGKEEQGVFAMFIITCFTSLTSVSIYWISAVDLSTRTLAIHPCKGQDPSQAAEGHPCPGYHLTFPTDQSPLMSCPFLFHARMPFPRTISTNANWLFLHLTDCSGTSKISTKGKEFLPQPCTFCANLNNHNIIMGFIIEC